MTAFSEDVLKIIIDKALLGLIAAVFGFYLSRLLEDYRQNRSYELLVAQRRLDTLSEVIQLVVTQHQRLERLVKVVRKILEMHPNRPPEEEISPAYDFPNSYEEFTTKLKVHSPLLPPAVIEACSAYLDVYGGVRAVVEEKPEAKLPSDEQLNDALMAFLLACSSALTGESSQDATSKAA